MNSLRFLSLVALKGWLWAPVVFMWAVSAGAQEEIWLDGKEMTFNFGTVDASVEAVAHTFIIRNTSERVLSITRVTVSCGCTRPVYSRKPIIPGDTGKLTVSFHPEGRPGPFYKTVAIYSNDKPEAYRLTLKGEVVIPVFQDTIITAAKESIIPNAVIEKRPSFFQRLRRRF